MTRPEIIRADSIDLQDRDAPSAQDHARLNPSAPSKSAANGSLAPHQAETLREVAAETAEERRLSWNNGDIGDLQQYAEDLAAGVANSFHSSETGGRRMAGQQQDALAIAQNGGHNVEEEDLEDADDMDDDMMDKISSSPSIEDGVYLFAMSSVTQHKPCSPGPSPSPADSSASITCSDARSSSPYPELIEQPLLFFSATQTGKDSVELFNRHHHHHPSLGEYEQRHRPRPERPASPRSITRRADDEETDSDDDLLSLDADYASISSEVMIEVLDSTIRRVHKSGRRQQKNEPTETDEAVGGLTDGEIMIPYDGSSGDDDDFSLSCVDSRFVDSGWGGECLHDTEDIDFEFVYALHTFVATVEGQANATKGDTMVLLDDSNSYWWLVRVVKDSSIGYLPAEHIETPTERLARLNKHRNIDLSATMLGDQAEKTKNPLRSAMRRRKAKNVSFAAPTYVDYSDIDYSTEEEEDDVEGDLEAQKSQQQQQQAQQQQSQSATQGDAEAEDETAKVEPLKPRSQKQADVTEAKDGVARDADIAAANRTSEEIFEASKSETPGPTRTKDGTVRDSFFKDETVETKKITLTPNLLRDDGAPRTSTESKDLKQRPSLDKVDKELQLGKDDKKKKDKKEKDKKSGSIRSFFSRKDKKKLSVDEDDDSLGKGSMDIEIPEKEPEENDGQGSPEKQSSGPQRQPSKLQKAQPRTEPSPTRKGSGSITREQGGMDVSSFLNEEKLKSVATVPPATMRIVESDTQDLQNSQRPRDRSPEVTRSTSQREEKSGLSKIIPGRSQSGEVKPQKVTKAKSRVELDDFDVSEEEVEEVAPAPQRAAPVPDEKQRQQAQEQQVVQRPTLPGSFPDSYVSTQSAASDRTEKAADPAAQVQNERLSESPVHDSPATSNPPALMGDTSSQEERSSPISSPSPELVETEDGSGAHRNQDSIATSTSATTTSTWNDSSLRAFFDSGSDIRDLLVVVYDKSDVEPAGSDHPVVGTLFKEQNARLAEITTQLDNMLGDWLARKQRLRGTV